MLSRTCAALAALSLALIGCGGDDDDGGGAAAASSAQGPAALEDVLANPRPSLPVTCGDLAPASEIDSEKAARGTVKAAFAECEGDVEDIGVLQMKDASADPDALFELFHQEDRPIADRRDDVGELPEPSVCADAKDGDEQYTWCAAAVGKYVVFALGQEDAGDTLPPQVAKTLADYVANAG